MGGPTGLKNGIESGLFQTLAQLVADTNVKANTTVSVFEQANRGDYYVTAIDEGSGIALANGLFANKLASGGGGITSIENIDPLSLGFNILKEITGGVAYLRGVRGTGAVTLSIDANGYLVVNASTSGGGIPEAPVDGTFYGRKDAAWASPTTDDVAPTASRSYWTPTLQSTLDNKLAKSTYDPQNIAADAFARANHTGTQAISTVTGLQTALDGKEDTGTAAAAVSAHVAAPDPHTQYALESSLAPVATSGSYDDLTDTPIDYIEGTQALGSTTGSVNVVIANGAYITATSTGITTWTFDTSALGANQVASWVVMLTNGGSFTQTFTGAKWGDGTLPLFSTGLDRLVFTFDGTDLIGTLSEKAIA